MKQNYSLLSLFIIILALVLQPLQPVAAATIPVTGASLESAQPAGAAATSLANFAASVAVSGNPDLVAGIFARGLFAAPIVQQPASNPGFVSTIAESATQFSMAAQYGSVALLAHNYLLGAQFFSVQQGKALALVYGDGRTETYRVKQVLKYQALSPNNPYSDFVDLNDPNGALLTATDLFYKVYTQDGTLVLQTCIEANGDPSWGRLFVIAEPASIVMAQEPNRFHTVAMMSIR